MSLKPIISGQSLNTNNDFSTETVANRLAYETLQTKALSTKDKNRLKDPQGIIPNGIYKVFSLEKSVKLASIISSLIIFIISAIFITLFMILLIKLRISYEKFEEVFESYDPSIKKYNIYLSVLLLTQVLIIILTVVCLKWKGGNNVRNNA